MNLEAFRSNSMSSFTVQFDQPLAFVVTANALDVAQTAMPPTSESASSPTEQTLLLQTAKSIESRLNRIDQIIQSQNQLISNAAVEYAIEISKTILQSDDELIKKRIAIYVDQALKNTEPTGPARIFVHSQFTQNIESWISQETELQFVVAADDALPAGDCRIEFGEVGLLASLTHQLELIKAKLIKAIDDAGSTS